MTVQAQGVFTYNGITFGPYTKSTISGMPVKSADGRSVRFVEWTITAESYVVGGTGNGAETSDDDMVDLRRALTKPGQALVYTGHGFGDLIVNAGGLSVGGGSVVQDVEFGPWPQLLSWTPCGGNVTALVTWKCVVRIPECTGAAYKGEPIELLYTVDTDLDQDGYTTVKVGGHVTIAMTRGNGNQLPDNVDRYREKVRPAIIPGFQRIGQSFKVSPDRRTLNFNFTDREMPSAYPDFVTRADVHQRLSSNQRAGFTNWTGSISGTITMAANVPKSAAYDRMLQIVASRLGRAKEKVKDFVLIGNKGGAGMVYLESMELDDDIFGRTVGFNIGYRIMGVPLKKILHITGMFRAIDGTNFNTWAQSISEASDVRGVAGIKHTPKDDLLIDLCTSHDIRVSSGSGLVRLRAQPVDQQETIDGVDPNKSWLLWQCEIKTEDDEKKVRHKPLGAVLRNRDWIQEIAGANFAVRMVGRAKRVGYQIDPPKLEGFGNQVLMEVRRSNVRRGQDGMVGGIPIYWATWDYIYILTGRPDRPLEAPPNPLLGLKPQLVAMQPED